MVQQKQGRVKPTQQMNGKISINDDAGLEKEADVMGLESSSFQSKQPRSIPKAKSKSNNIFQVGRLSVISQNQPVQMEGGRENWDKLKSKISITSDPIKMSGEIAKGKTPLNVHGASMSRRMDRKDQIASPELLYSPDKIKNHLGKFADGAHAFITPEKNKNIKGDWGWGLDKNFVTPLREAEVLVNEAQGEKGIFTLEEKLGIPHLKPWSWASEEKNPENIMWRYIIPNPQDYNLNMASGKEIGAYKEEWIAGGKTLGGGYEAVIDKIPRVKLLLEIAKGKILTEEVKFPTTKNYFNEFKKQSE